MPGRFPNSSCTSVTRGLIAQASSPTHVVTYYSAALGPGTGISYQFPADAELLAHGLHFEWPHPAPQAPAISLDLIL